MIWEALLSDAELTRLWIYLVTRAATREEEASIQLGRAAVKVKVHPGELLYGRSAFAKALKTSESKVRRRMSMLHEAGLIRVSRQEAGVDGRQSQPAIVTIVTICYWSDWAALRTIEKPAMTAGINLNALRVRGGDAPRAKPTALMLSDDDIARRLQELRKPKAANFAGGFRSVFPEKNRA